MKTKYIQLLQHSVGLIFRDGLSNDTVKATTILTTGDSGREVITSIHMIRSEGSSEGVVCEGRVS